MSNDTMFAQYSNVSRDRDMELYDKLPREVRQALANANHDWAAAQSYRDVVKRGGSARQDVRAIKSADKRQADLYQWGLERGFPDRWAKRASASLAARRRRERKEQ